MSSRRYVAGPVVPAVALAVCVLTYCRPTEQAQAAAQTPPAVPSPHGGFVESATSNAVRPKPTQAQIAAFLPAHRGPFTFPAPYNTQGYRLTEPSDCAGGADCVYSVGYAYWRNLNNSAGSNTLYAIITLHQDGGGPTLFAIDKTTGAVTKLGLAFGPDNPGGTGEGIYWSARQPTKAYYSTFTRLYRHDVFTHQQTVAVDMNSPAAVATFGPGHFLWQANSDDSDTVHVFSVEDSQYNRVGCGVSFEASGTYKFFPSSNLDECGIDKGGRYLVIYEGDKKVVDLQTGATQTLVPNSTNGNIGHGDLGYGYSVSEDNYGVSNADMRLRLFSRPLSDPANRVQVYRTNQWADQSTHMSHTNARPGDPATQYGCGSTIYGAPPSSPVPREGELICYPFDGSLRVLVVAPSMVDAFGPGGDSYYWRLPKANLDPTGEYLVWTSNMMGSGRLDAFVVRVPYELLTGVTGPGDTTAPKVALTAPPNGATLSGPVLLAATATDEVAVGRVEFDLNGSPLDVAVAPGKCSAIWDTRQTPNGAYTLTAVAYDTAGNRGISAPRTVTVFNTPGSSASSAPPVKLSGLLSGPSPGCSPAPSHEQ
jgi:Bacterial Ig domain